jgi:hypothetical protein
MSPSSSTIPPSESTRRPAPHSRKASATIITKTGIDLSMNQQRYSTQDVRTPTSATKSNVHYTLFIRLPFRRGDFQDPPPVEWDAIKDRALWKIISSSSSNDLDWEALSTRFDVPLSFLLQQAAWLYERHFEGMKKQMQRLGVSGTPSPIPQSSPRPGDDEATAGSGTASGEASGVGGVAMERKASRGKQVSSCLASISLRHGQNHRDPLRN